MLALTFGGFLSIGLEPWLEECFCSCQCKRATGSHYLHFLSRQSVCKKQGYLHILGRALSNPHLRQ